MRYEWNRSGVTRAVEDVMREHPELEQSFWVAEARDPNDYTWHVELDPDGERRIARLTWQMIEDDQLDEIAATLTEAGLASAETFA
jgi:hypothetical protein